MQKWFLSLVALTVWLVLIPAGGAGPASAAAGGQPELDGAWPLAPRPSVVNGFDPPATPWGRGHRGVDLAGSPGQTVFAALPGTISFTGVIAGKSVVVVDHGDTRTTYEPVVATVSVGDLVARGAPIGRLEVSGSHCLPAACLHWGWIRNVDDVYLDPLTLVGAQRVRLLPAAGLPAVDLSGSRMGLPIGLAESVAGDVGVDLGRGHGGVAEQLLHSAKVGAALQ